MAFFHLLFFLRKDFVRSSEQCYPDPRHESVTRLFWPTRSNLRRVYSLVLSCVVNKDGSEVSETFVTNMPRGGQNDS